MRPWILTIALGTQLLAMAIAFAEETPSPPSAPAPRANEAACCVEGRRMQGPFANLSDYCRKFDSDPAICQHPLAPQGVCASAEFAIRNLKPPFLDARILFLGGSPGACLLATRTESGWYVEDPGDEISTKLLLADSGRYESEVMNVESGPEGTLIERAVFLHWTAAEKMDWIKKPLRESWYECEERLTVCGIGASGAPSCTPSLPVGYTLYCRDEENPQRKLRLPRQGVDFRLAVRIADGRIHVATPDGRRIKEALLPEWLVTARGAKHTADKRRSVTPPPVTLHFP